MTKDQAPAKMKIIYLSMAPWLCILLIAFSSKPGTIKPIPATNGTRAVIIEQPVMQDENKPSIAPVEMTKAKLSAVYGERIHPATGKNRLHSGVDFKAAEGVPVMATAAGVVAVSRFDSMLGNYVVINHSKTYATSYSHMKSCEVKFGDPVK